MAQTAPCGLYLVLPDHWTDEAFLKSMGDVFRALNASPYEKNNHVIELRQVNAGGDPLFEGKAMALAELSRQQGIVFIVHGDAQRAKKYAADGVLLDQADDIAQARALLGKDAIIGVRCGTDRQVAGAALEAGADYVAFSDMARGYIDPALVRWWSDQTDIPCLVEGRYTNDDCAFYVQADAYFIEASQYVWNHEKGVMQGIVNMTHAIDLAAGKDNKSKKKIQ